MTLDRDLFRQLANLLGILAAFAINVLTNIRPPTGRNIGEISNTVFQNVLITPANYAFAIWGLIYLGLLSLGVYQALPENKTRFRFLGYGLAIASLWQIIWVYLFQYGFYPLSLLAMLGILLALIWLYLRLPALSGRQRWFLSYPVSLYLGWISVATIVNGAIALYWLQWDGFGIDGSIWTAIILGIGVILGIYMANRRKDRVFAGVFLWAFVAIAVKHFAIPLIAGTAIGAAILVVIACLVPPLPMPRN
jgi:hypothetical protein